jgi:hypothetical protein
MTTEEAIRRFGDKVDCQDEGAGTCRQLVELCEVIERLHLTEGRIAKLEQAIRETIRFMDIDIPRAKKGDLGMVALRDEMRLMRRCLSEAMEVLP